MPSCEAVNKIAQNRWRSSEMAQTIRPNSNHRWNIRDAEWQCISIFKVIDAQLTGWQPSQRSASASQFIQQNERWIFIHVQPSILAAIRERSIVDHRGCKPRDETGTDDESMPLASTYIHVRCVQSVPRLPVTDYLDEHGWNREHEPSTFSVPRANRNIFRSPCRRIIHPRASFLVGTADDLWSKTARKGCSPDTCRWCHCQDQSKHKRL